MSPHSQCWSFRIIPIELVPKSRSRTRIIHGHAGMPSAWVWTISWFPGVWTNDLWHGCGDVIVLLVSGQPIFMTFHDFHAAEALFDDALMGLEDILNFGMVHLDMKPEPWVKFGAKVFAMPCVPQHKLTWFMIFMSCEYVWEDTCYRLQGWVPLNLALITSNYQHRHSAAYLQACNNNVTTLTTTSKANIMLQCSPGGAESCSAIVIDLGTLHNINENRTSLAGTPGCLGEISIVGNFRDLVTRSSCMLWAVRFLAPEAYPDYGGHNGIPANDVWAMGVTLYQLLAAWHCQCNIYRLIDGVSYTLIPFHVRESPSSLIGIQ